MTSPLARSNPASLDLDPQAIDRTGEIVARHLAEGTARASISSVTCVHAAID